VGLRGLRHYRASGAGAVPRDAFAAGLAQGGPRLHRHIPDDEDFRLFTLPTTRKGTAQVHPRLGVKIHSLCYWSDAFLDPELAGTQVPVRYDPFDAGLAYAFVKQRWVRCISEHHARLACRSEREIQFATAELRRRHQRHGQRLSITARTLADFLASLEAEEALLEQRLQDAALKDVLAGAERERVRDPQPAPASALACPEGLRDSQAPGWTSGAAPAGAGAALRIYEDY
jgi:hypothetical protein